MNPLDNCQRAIEGAQAIVNQVRPEDLSKASPCQDWDVRTLLNHMVEALQTLTAPARGEEMKFSAQAVQNLIGDDPSGVYDRTAKEFLEAWRVPGVMDRVIKTGFGDQPAGFYVTLALADQLLHGWDLAKAINTPYQMDPELAEGVLSAMQQMLQPGMRGPGKAFSEEVPCDPNASVQERLVAFSGRKA